MLRESIIFLRIPKERIAQRLANWASAKLFVAVDARKCPGWRIKTHGMSTAEPWRWIIESSEHPPLENEYCTTSSWFIGHDAFTDDIELG